MSDRPCIALIAHDQKKAEMAEFARRHQLALPPDFELLRPERQAGAFWTPARHWM